jgi:HK97 family phage prohead protease
MTDERQAAAARRKAAAEKTDPQVMRAQVPCAYAAWQERAADRPRSVPFAAQLRATPVKRNGQDLIHLDGIASVTDTPYEMWDWAGPYDEIVAREAFDDTLAASPDVAFLVNHRGVTMARTTNSTLALGMVEAGFHSDAWVNPKRQDVSDLVVAVDDKNIDQMSFAFMLEEGWWNDDFSVFKITKLNIDRGDVSAVNYGANPYTSIAARSRDILEDVDHMPAGIAREAYERLGRRTDFLELDRAEENGTTESRTPAPQSDGAGMSITQLDAWIATIEAGRTP